MKTAIVVCLILAISVASALEGDIYTTTNIDVADTSIQTTANSDISIGLKNDVRATVNSNNEIELEDAESDDNAPQGTILKATLSDGSQTYIKISPATAALKAQLETKSACEEKCEVELKEKKVQSETKAVYEVQVEKESKVFGFINADMYIDVSVDAQTGTVLEINKPWWAFLAVEQETSANVQAEANSDY
jgi:uncharacterized membrane protein YkoI